MDYLMVALGKDNLIHCSDVNDLTHTSCTAQVPVKQVNPDFHKLPSIRWCYECSALLEKESLENEKQDS